MSIDQSSLLMSIDFDDNVKAQNSNNQNNLFTIYENQED